jgi:hypothetical protein
MTELRLQAGTRRVFAHRHAHRWLTSFLRGRINWALAGSGPRARSRTESCLAALEIEAGWASARASLVSMSHYHPS